MVPVPEDVPVLPEVFLAAVPAEFFFADPVEGAVFAAPEEGFFLAVPAAGVFLTVPTADVFLTVPAEVVFFGDPPDDAFFAVPEADVFFTELPEGVLPGTATLFLRAAAVLAWACFLLFSFLLILSDCLLSSTGCAT